MTAYDPTHHRTVVQANGEASRKFYAINKLVMDMGAAGIINLAVQDEAPSDTTKIWLDLTQPEAGNAAVKAWNGSNWVPLTPALFLELSGNAALEYLQEQIDLKQPLDTDLSEIAALTTQAYGRSLLTLANAAALAAAIDSFFLTPAEGNAAYQPLDSDLEAIAALSTNSFGRGLLALSSAAAIQAYIGVREVLTANRTYYVRTDGNDANDGLANSSGGAFLTIQRAISAVSAIDLSIYNVTIQLGNGTYGGFVISKPWVGNGSVIVRGDPTTPSNVTINGSIAAQVDGSGSNIVLTGLTIAATTIGLYANAGGTVNCSTGIVFAGSPTYHMRTNGQGCLITFTAGYTIASGATYHMAAGPGGAITMAGITNTVTGTPAFGIFAYANRLGIITCTSVTFSGAATGKRYQVESNAVIATGGSGASFFPGNVAGTDASGGQYV